jgi:hypothetical protein
MVRAYELKNGDVVFSSNGVVDIYFQYEDKYLYEVESIGIDEFGQDIWNKTGRMTKSFKNLSEIVWENI